MLDIKWKNLIRQWYMKLIAYGIIFACATLFLVWGWDCIKTNRYNGFYVLETRNYQENTELKETMRHFAQSIKLTKSSYLNAEKIKNGDYAKEQVERDLQAYYQEWLQQDPNMRIEVTLDTEGGVRVNWYNPKEHLAGQEATLESDVNPSEEGSEKGNQTVGNIQDFLKQNPNLEEQLTKVVIKDQLDEYLSAQRNLGRHKALIGDVLTKDSMLDTLSKQAVLLYISQGEDFTFSLPQAGTQEELIQQAKEALKREDEEPIIVVGMEKQAFAQAKKNWEDTYDLYTEKMAGMAGVFLLAALAFFYLVAVTGRRPEEEEVHLYPFDHLWGEFQGVIGLLGLGITMWSLNYIYLELVVEAAWVVRALGILAIEVGAFMMLLVILSQIRRMKAKAFFMGFLLFKLLRNLWHVIKSLWNRSSLTRKLVLLAIVLPLVCATIIGIPFVIGLLLYFLYRHLHNYLNICEGATQIRGGKSNYKIETTETQGTLYQLTDDLNEISQGLNSAISNEVKSERLKTELISNVSHDLKTPLTSIVSYVALLRQEELQNDKAKEYIEIIAQKANRLSVLTNDLFEAAKATSGDMPVNLARVNLTAIVHQALGEYEEKLAQGEFIIKTDFPQDPAYVNLDGRLTWRVIANLLSNVIKYAQSGSRVYIEIKEEEQSGRFVFTMKNISAYELNIPAEELMERFKRGDVSRNTEGSGLGLSIANSLVLLQNGTFEVIVDGDLFKVIITFPKA